MKTPDMAKENNFVLREAAKAAQMGYFDHLSAGGKGDPAEERWIEALTAGADAITQVVVLESRLAQVERERDAAVHDLPIGVDCDTCKYSERAYEEQPCSGCKEYRGPWYPLHWEWRGVFEEKEET